MDELAGPDMEERLSVRPISIEEAFRRQHDRISYLRSAGLAWAEAVYGLRDVLVGVEDDEFWDGMPPKVRKEVEGLEAEGNWQSVERAAELREAWAPFGWQTIKLPAIRGRGGRPVYRPSPSDLSDLLRIVLRLASRLGITWRKTKPTSLPRWEEADDA